MDLVQVRHLDEMALFSNPSINQANHDMMAEVFLIEPSESRLRGWRFVYNVHLIRDPTVNSCPKEKPRSLP